MTSKVLPQRLLQVVARTTLALAGALALFVLLALVVPAAREAGLPLTGDLTGVGTALGTQCLDSIDNDVRDPDSNEDPWSYSNDWVAEVRSINGGAYYDGTGCSYTYRYWHLMILDGSTSATSSSACGKVSYIGNQTGMSVGWTYSAIDYRINTCGGSSQGTHSGRIYLARCANGSYNSGGSINNPWASLNSGGRNCIVGTIYDPWSIVVDLESPGGLFVGNSNSNTYSNSTSFTFDWGLDDPSPSTGHWRTYRDLYRAPMTNGSCGSASLYTSYGWQTTGEQSATLANGYCWRLRINLQDGAGNSSGAHDSGWRMIDTVDPSASWVSPVSATQYQNTTSFNFDWAFSDSSNGSGYDRSTLLPQRAPVPSPGACGGASYTNQTSINTTAGAYNYSGMSGGYCWRMGVRVQDNAGNLSPSWVYSAAVLVDTAAPTGSFASLPAYDTDGSVTTSLTTSDAHSDYGTWSVDLQRRSISNGSCSGGWSTIETSVDSGSAGVSNRQQANNGLGHGYCYRWRLNGTDQAGNSLTTYSNETMVDTVAPVWTGFSAPANNGWVPNGAYTFAWTQFTDDASGYVDTEIELQRAALDPDGSCPTGSMATVASTTITSASYQPTLENGYCYRLRLSSTDAAGNTSPALGYYYSSLLYVDGEAPVSAATITSGTSGLNGWYVTPVTVSITSTDEDSGFDTTDTDRGVIKYRINGGSVITCDFATCGQGDGSMNLALDLNSDGIFTINYWAIDVAGNTEGTHTLTVKVDTSPPSGCMISAVEETTATTVDVTVTGCTDVNGLDGARFGDEVGYNWNNAYANIGWVDYTGGTITRSVTLESGSGDYKILVQVRDEAGNMAFLDTTTTLNTAVNYPILGPGAYIYECGASGDPEEQLNNQTGTVYWAVDQALCLIPHIGQITPGERVVGSETLTSRVVTPLIEYRLLADPNDPERSGMTYPTAAVGTDRTAADSPLQFGFNRETSGMEHAVPVIIIPVQITAEIGWFDSTDTQVGPSEQITTRVELRVVVRNTGRTGGGSQ